MRACRLIGPPTSSYGGRFDGLFCRSSLLRGWHPSLKRKSSSEGERCSIHPFAGVSGWMAETMQRSTRPGAGPWIVRGDRSDGRLRSTIAPDT